MRILLVDDNQTNLMLLTKLVAKLPSCEPVPFLDPSDVLAAMPKLEYDIAVIDYQMPGYNGVELLREIEKEMKAAAKDLEFEKAAALRDQLIDLRRLMELKKDPKAADQGVFEPAEA